MFAWSEALQFCRCCCHCGSVGKIDILCKTCWGKLTDHRTQPLKLIHTSSPFPVYALFVWQSELITHLIYALKNGQCSQAQDKIASWFLASRLAQSNLPHNPILVPSPPAQLGQKDHAYELAKKLAQLLEKPLDTSLRRVHSTPSKRKSAQKRKQETAIQSEFLENKPQSVIFIDDVYTTGATAEAAYKALDCPVDFEVWVLAYRPKLAITPQSNENT